MPSSDWVHLPSNKATKDVDLDIDHILSMLVVEPIHYQPGTYINLPENTISLLITKCREILLSQPVFAELQPPIIICGDTHGQFYDLLRIFRNAGYPDGRRTRYLFLGDYVDRGKQSIEVICTMMAYKIKYPNDFFILRGNHESESINRVYGFYDECKRRYSVKLFKRFSDLFECLPPAGLVGDKILCMHGGISPELTSLDQIRRLKRPAEIDAAGLLTDLVWSDPSPDADGWTPNKRGISFEFGRDVVAHICDLLNIDLIARAHMVVEDGYEFYANRRLVTIFSAPNYCGYFDNAGGIMTVDETLLCSFKVLKPRGIPRPALNE